MPEAVSDFQGFAVRFQDSAREARARLLPQEQLELLRLIDEFSEDPDRFRQRVEGISGTGNLLYTHPFPALEITYRVDREKKIITFIDISSRAMIGSLVVISYSHADEKWRDELKKFLKPLVRENRIHIWDDTAIDAGDRWREEIARFFGSARIAIFLVSQDFLASDFITEHELPQLLEAAKNRTLRLLWIAVRSSTPAKCLEALQALNNPNRPLDSLRRPARERELAEISRKILAAVEEISVRAAS